MEFYNQGKKYNLNEKPSTKCIKKESVKIIVKFNE